MNYTITQKLKSVIYNLSKTSLEDIWNFWFMDYGEKRKALKDVVFGGDITQEKDYDGNDYTLDGNDVASLPQLKPEIQWVIDQGRAWRTRNGCVIVQWYLNLCMGLGITPIYEDLLSWLIFFENKKVDGKPLWYEGYGASIPLIHKYGCAEWNKRNPNNKVTYYRNHWSSNALKELESKGYQSGGGYNTFDAYTSDRNDGVINKNNYPGWKRKGGHSLSKILGNKLKGRKIVEVWKKGSIINHKNLVKSDNTHIIDNYPGTRSASNIYENKYIEQHCENNIWYSWFYTIVSQNPSELKNVKTVSEVNVSGEYRNLVGKSVFKDTEKAGEVLRKGSNDEAIAIIEKICERVIKKG